MKLTSSATTFIRPFRHLHIKHVNVLQSHLVSCGYADEDLIKYAWPEDVWFHVDKLSSAHVYIRLPGSIPSWEEIPEALLTDAAQLVKANSIEGNKKENITVIYTPASNLKKTGDMAVGQVSFKSDKKEQIERQKKEKAESRALAAIKRKEAEELAKQRAAEKAARDYALLDVVDPEDEEATKPKSVQEMLDDFM
ncbi:hypothetical protein A7U60_g1697 [Sanghuangporus baumii]|uniref:NFACT RNA-binding domain-containing protein n=1 Tax=Sanghuangporus baumii TaxID=108892 RepID=A0A9Q5I3K2_SANBA|nr:hypothetical protein A7U60_g1697 [Sanghuangporus baumii]